MKWVNSKTIHSTSSCRSERVQTACVARGRQALRQGSAWAGTEESAVVSKTEGVEETGMGLECGVGGGLGLSGWPGKTHATWSIKAAAPGETGGEVKQVGVKAGGQSGESHGNRRCFHEWKIGNIGLQRGRWWSYTGPLSKSLREPRRLCQRQVSEQDQESLLTALLKVKKKEWDYRLSWVQTTRTVVESWQGHLLQPYTRSGCCSCGPQCRPHFPRWHGSTCKAAQPCLWETDTERDSVHFWGKKMYLFSSGTAEVEGQWKTPLSPRAGTV